MLNEHVYCPRLAYLEWVDQGFVDNADTVEGRFVHRRADREPGSPPAPGEDGARGTAAGAAVGQLAALAPGADMERRLQSLLGIEGTAARIYFREFAKLLAPRP